MGDVTKKVLRGSGRVDCRSANGGREAARRSDLAPDFSSCGSHLLHVRIPNQTETCDGKIFSTRTGRTVQTDVWSLVLFWVFRDDLLQVSQSEMVPPQTGLGGEGGGGGSRISLNEKCAEFNRHVFFSSSSLKLRLQRLCQKADRQDELIPAAPLPPPSTPPSPPPPPTRRDEFVCHALVRSRRWLSCLMECRAGHTSTPLHASLDAIL